MLHHELEGAAVFRVCAGIAVIHEGAVVNPVGIIGNQLLVRLLLQLHGRDLILVVRGDTAVGGDAEDPPVIIRLVERRDLQHITAVIPSSV